MVKNTHSKKIQKIVIGNWKMNPQSLDEAKHIIGKTRKTAKRLGHTQIIVCPPFPFIPYVLSRKSRKSENKNGNKGGDRGGDRSVKINEIKVGAQNVFYEEQGAFTGEVSAHELADLGVTHVIVGHSERRWAGGDGALRGETDMEVSKKAAAVAQAGMTAVLCVGEKSRDVQGEYLDTLREQIKASLQAFSRRALGQLIIAYEPIWAIGAKAAMTPALVRETAIFIKKVLSDMYGQENAVDVPILYGGSVNFRNAADIITQGEVDGLLVGRESVNVPGFVELLKTVDGVGGR